MHLRHQSVNTSQNRNVRSLSWVLPFAFYLFLFLLIPWTLMSPPRGFQERVPEPITSARWSEFLEVRPDRIKLVGAELDMLLKVMPKKGTLTLLFDRPYEQENAPNKELFRIMQARFCPLILNWSPGETNGFILGSSNEKAEAYLKKTGYAWVTPPQNGKGWIRKVR